MTGVRELRDVAVVSAAPEAIRVSVLGGRTQLDVALPADVPVAAFLPELAKLISSRDARDEETRDRDERRTFWVLRRVDGDVELAPEQTLRGAGIGNGALLRVSQQRALSPPTLYDDVVDAAARLNRAAYAAWDATAAGVMAILGLWACSAAWTYFLVAAAFSVHRGVIIVGAALTVVTMVGGAAIAHRALGRIDIASAAGPPAIVLTAALGFTLTHRHGEHAIAIACVVLLILAAAYYRVIGTGHWAYIAGAVVFVFGALALAGSALGGARADVIATAAATVAALAALAVPQMTARLGQSPPTTRHVSAREDGQLDDLFAPADDARSGAAMPSAEEVWARVRWAAHTRAGLMAGLAGVVVTGSVVLLRSVLSWPALTFVLICAAVLGLRSRRARSAAERAALAVPATALVLIACAQVQAGSESVRLAGIAVLAVGASFASVAGLISSDGRSARWAANVAAYLEYVLVAALIPLALWPLGFYDRLGL